MRSILALTVVAFVGYGIIDAAPARATKYFTDKCPDDNDWDRDGTILSCTEEAGRSNWSDFDCDSDDEASQPAATDDVVICANKTALVNDSDDVGQYLTLEAGTPGPTRIDIDPDTANATLTLGSGGTALVSTLNAASHILLQEDPGVGTFVAKLAFVTVDHRVTGLGQIRGEDSLAVIEVTPAVTPMESEVTIRGALKISGAGDFLNDGRVVADRTDGTLDMLISGMLDDTIRSGEVSANYRWGVTGSGSTLRFNQDVNCVDSSTQLLGSFYVADGTLRIGQDAPTDDIVIEIRGDYLHDGGETVVGVDDSISFNLPACP